MVRQKEAKDLLKDYKIVYDDPKDSLPLTSREIPRQSKILRDALLDFTSLLPDSFRDFVIEKHSGADDTIWDSPKYWYYDVRCDDYREAPAERLKDPRWGMLKLNEKNCWEAKRLSDAMPDMEYSWQSFYERKLFHPLEEEVRDACGPRRFMKTNHCYENFVGYSQIHWNKHSIIRPPFDPSLPALWQPRPDYALYLPTSMPGRKHYAGFMKRHEKSYIGSLKYRASIHFPIDILEDLSDHGLQYSTSSTKYDMKTFPWFVAEFKKKHANSTEQEYCYCQAANAASVVLAMYENAARYNEDIKNNKHVPPLPVMTAIGPKVVIWVAFSTNEGPGPTCRMTPVWRGDMTSFRGMLEMKIILENAHTWAMHVLRPHLGTCIDQWRYRFCKQKVRTLKPLGLDLDIVIRLKARPSKDNDDRDLIRLSTQHNISGLGSDQERALLCRMRRLLHRELEPHLPEGYFRHRRGGSNKEENAQYKVAEPQAELGEYEIDDDEEFSRQSPSHNQSGEQNNFPDPFASPDRTDNDTYEDDEEIDDLNDDSEKEQYSSSENSEDDDSTEQYITGENSEDDDGTEQYRTSDISRDDEQIGNRRNNDDSKQGSAENAESGVPSTPKRNRPIAIKSSSEPSHVRLSKSRDFQSKRKIPDGSPLPLRSRAQSTGGDKFTSAISSSFDLLRSPSETCEQWISRLEHQGLFVLNSQMNKKEDKRASRRQRSTAYLCLATDRNSWQVTTKKIIRTFRQKFVVGSVAAWDYYGTPEVESDEKVPLLEFSNKGSTEWENGGVFACVFQERWSKSCRGIGVKKENIVIYEVVGTSDRTSLGQIVDCALQVFIQARNGIQTS